MNSKLFLRIAAGLTLFTAVGHTMGALAPLADRPTDVIQVVQDMMSVMVPMPMGRPQNLYDLMRGANFCLSIYLFVSGFLFVILSSGTKDPTRTKIISLNSLGLAGVAILSWIYFFPLPSICTGLAALMGFTSLKTRS